MSNSDKLFVICMDSEDSGSPLSTDSNSSSSECQKGPQTPCRPYVNTSYVNVTPLSDEYERKYVHLDDADEINSFDGFQTYERDTYMHRMSLETHYYPQSFLKLQPEMTPETRSVLVEWITRVCHQYSTFPETLFLAVNLVDRFLQTTPIALDCAQLLGAASLLIASKQEEPIAMHLGVTQILQMMQAPYARRQILQMERLVLRRLQFDLLAPTPLYFMETLVSYTTKTHQGHPTVERMIEKRCSLARYMLELSLQDYDLCQYSPSLLATCILAITEEVMRDGYIFFQPGASARMRGKDFKSCLRDLKLLAEATLETDSCSLDSFDSGY